MLSFMRMMGLMSKVSLLLICFRSLSELQLTLSVCALPLCGNIMALTIIKIITIIIGVSIMVAKDNEVKLNHRVCRYQLKILSYG